MPLLSIAQTLCPTGKLRAAINLGNPILANIDPATNQVFGVSVDLAHELAKRLDVELNLVVVAGAAKSVTALNDELADVGFFAIDPLRGAEIAFTAPYVLIEGCYLVSTDSALRTNADIDKAGVRVVVSKGSAYDLFLTRELKNAEIVREANFSDAMDAFLTQKLEVAAGIKQQLFALSAHKPSLRLLDDNFMVIQQAMGVRKRYGNAAAVFVSEFVKEMKLSGFVAAALIRHGIQGATVAN
jgi:polar amino acid transport system substrate-binding protein